MVAVNGRTVKPAYQVKVNDVVAIKGSRALTVEVLDIPAGSLPREQREKYFKEL